MKKRSAFNLTILSVSAILLAACLTSSCTKNDKTKEVTGVSLNMRELTLTEGETETLTATVMPEDATNKNVSWTSDNDDVATVDQTGIVTAVKAGETDVTVTTEDGNKTATCKVTVNAKVIFVTGVSLDKTEITLVEGESDTLTAAVMPDDATNKNVSWTSDNEEIATVDETGIVTAVKAGEANITVTTEDGGKTAICKVTVKNKNISFTVNDVSFEMVYVQGGTFWMGAQSNDPEGQNYDPDAYNWEAPVHQVTLSDYYIGQCEVTQALWKAVTGTTIEQQRDLSNPGWPLYGVGDDCPMYYVSWDDIVNEFLPKLNQMTGKTFVLPTEAQWEFAARGGSNSKGYTYCGGNNIDDVAWYRGNSEEQSHPVGQKQPNELGIYDMSGNVWEWCHDWYGEYPAEPQTDPQGPEYGDLRIFRGGSWGENPILCIASRRLFLFPAQRNFYYGVRLALLP